MKSVTVLLEKSCRYGVPWWYRNEASGAVSATLFLCLKYLPAEQIDGWLESILKIDCAFWRGQIMVWLLGAKPLLEGRISQPAEFNESTPSIKWEWSHSLKGNYTGNFTAEAGLMQPMSPDDGLKQTGSGHTPFICGANRAAFNCACRRMLTRETRETWCYQVMSIPLLEDEMGGSIDEFATLELPETSHKTPVLAGPADH